MKKISGLYVVTDDEIFPGRNHRYIAEQAAAGGAAVIQLRDKTATAGELYREALALKKICYGKALFIVNDRADAAIAAGAGGVHLGQSDMPVSSIRRIAPEGFIIGLSVSSVEQALEGAAAGADYLAVSPVFATDTKTDAGDGLGVDMIRAIKSALPDMPLCGIGGINRFNLAEAVRAGLDSAAVISAVVCAPDVKAAAAELSDIIQKEQFC